MSAFPTFTEFFSQVHGYSPFPWQTALADRVIDIGWPDLIDVPTGLGKTSVIDVAVYALAAEALTPPSQRRSLTRTALLVDRRLVVDGAFRHASKLADSLAEAPADSAVGVLAGRLAGLAAPTGHVARPLEVVRMRGGVTWTSRWIRSPDQPAVVVGTVDQLGSRLLFRDYGQSDRMKPIDAALVGTDMLCLLDEAHLSEALSETIQECQFHEARAEQRVGRPLSLVKMSATTRSQGATVHSIDDRDLDSVAEKRLTTQKRATLIELGPKAAGTPAPAFAALAKAIARPNSAVGVVMNTVGLARAVFDEVKKGGVDAALVIGRCRPIDRLNNERSWLSATEVGRTRSESKGFVLVATQTIEVGVDLDLDAIVTQSASIDALIQRFGRVDRLGEVGETHSVVVSVGGDVDPVYGDSVQFTWAALTATAPAVSVDDAAALAEGWPDDQPTVDFGPLAVRDWKEQQPNIHQLMAPSPVSPLPLASTLSCWRRTAPIPVPDEDIAPYLHGIGRWSPTVSVIWRCDLDDLDVEAMNEALEVLPPMPYETVEVSLGALRGLLAGEAVDVVDVEGIELSGARRPSRSEVMGRAWARRENRWAQVAAADVRPGDLVVVSSAAGGHDQFGWTGTLGVPVVDLGGLGELRQRGRSATTELRLRLSSPVLAQFFDGDALKLASEVLGDDPPGIVDILDRLSAAVMPGPYAGLISAVLERLVDGKLVGQTARSDNDLESRVSRVDVVVSPGASWFDTVADDGAGPSTSRANDEVRLATHLRSVGRRAGDHAQCLGFDPAIAKAVELAGRFHDLGKAEVRFQTMLHRGRRHAAEAAAYDAETALAKSIRLSRDAERQIARQSGWPVGMRHEAVSLLMVQAAPEKLFEGIDRALVEHLVASHHGHARPFFPPVIDRQPTAAEVSFDGATFTAATQSAHPALDHAATFDLLNDRYGTWGLALLETVVRLADMSVSEEGG